jgi:hypothetical protein
MLVEDNESEVPESSDVIAPHGCYGDYEANYDNH